MARVLLLLSFVFLWWAFYRRLGRREADTLTWGERATTSLACAVGVCSILGILSAFMGVFEPGVLVPVIVIVSILLRGKGRRSGDRAPCGGGIHRFSSVPLAWILLLAAALFLFFRPGEGIIGNWDPGVYFAAGSHLAREGGWLMEDQSSSLMDEDERREVYALDRGFSVKYAGVYVDAERPKKLQPQFYPLYPVWIGYLSLAGGRHAALAASSLLSWLALLMVLLAGREVSGRLGSVLAGAAFLLNPVQIWFSGFHTAEVAMQFFFVSGLWLWLLWRRTARPFAAVLSGGMFMLTAFSSVTGMLLAPLVLVAHAVTVVLTRRGLRFFILPLLLFPLSAFQNVAMTPEYLTYVIRHFPYIREALLDVRVLVGFAVAALVLVLSRRLTHWKRALRIVLLAVAVFAFVALATLLYSEVFASSKWVGPAAMLSKTGLLSALLGLAVLSWRRPLTLPLVVGVTVVFSVVFFRSDMMPTLYPWAFKRWLTILLPIGCLGIACFWSAAVGWVHGRAAKLTLLVLAALVVSRPLTRGHAFAFHRDWLGLGDFLVRVDNAIPEDAVILSRAHLGLPLEFVHGRTVLPVYADKRDPEFPAALNAVLSRCLVRGTPVYTVRQKKDAWRHPFSARTVAEERLRTSTLHQSRIPFLRSLRNRDLDVAVERLHVATGGEQEN